MGVLFCALKALVFPLVIFSVGIARPMKRAKRVNLRLWWINVARPRKRDVARAILFRRFVGAWLGNIARWYAHLQVSLSSSVFEPVRDQPLVDQDARRIT